MNDVAHAGSVAGGPFRARTMMLIVTVGILSFVAMLLLGAFAPDLRTGRNGGAHALSNAATGFSGIVRLAAATGRDPHIVRDKRDYSAPGLLVITPETGVTNISAPLSARPDKPTLFVFPKWKTSADPGHPGWVQRDGIVGRRDPERVLAPADRLRIERRRSGGRPLVIAPEMGSIAFTAPRPLQVIVAATSRLAPGHDGRPAAIHPLIGDGAGGIVLAQLGDRPLYVLADPDLLSNQGMRQLTQARSALKMLDDLNAGSGGSIGFDVTMNGLGRSQSPLKLAFEPPFLAMTLAITAALLLAGLHALARFGAARRRERAIPFGKAALVDNSAAMIRRAGRETRMGAPYAGIIRDRAVAAFGVPARLRDETLDAYLDSLGGNHRFTDLARAAGDASDRARLVEAAQALHQWEKEKTG